MGLFKKYTISKNNINLVEHMFWAFNENNQNTIREWNFKNVENIDKIEEYFNQLIGYEEDCDIEIIENKNLNVKIHSIFDDFSFQFNCENYEINLREYKSEELIEIINNIQSHSLINYERIQELNSKINDLKNFLNNEISKKKLILTSEINQESKFKSEIELNLIKKIITKLNF